MILTVRILGLELLYVDISTDAPVEYDEQVPDLGTLGYDRIDAGDPDIYMGFTNEVRQ